MQKYVRTAFFCTYARHEHTNFEVFDDKKYWNHTKSASSKNGSQWGKRAGCAKNLFRTHFMYHRDAVEHSLDHFDPYTECGYSREKYFVKKKFSEISQENFFDQIFFARSKKIFLSKSDAKHVLGRKKSKISKFASSSSIFGTFAVKYLIIGPSQ